jgi:hypothetical protein
MTLIIKLKGSDGGSIFYAELWQLKQKERSLACKPTPKQFPLQDVTQKKFRGGDSLHETATDHAGPRQVHRGSARSI